MSYKTKSLVYPIERYFCQDSRWTKVKKIYRHIDDFLINAAGRRGGGGRMAVGGRKPFADT